MSGNDYIDSLVNNIGKAENYNKVYDFLVGSDPFLDTPLKRNVIAKLGRMELPAAGRLLEDVNTAREITGELFSREFGEIASVADKKEYDEVRYFHKIVRGVLPGYSTGHVVDMCSGNGLNAFYWLLQDSASTAYLVDKNETSVFKKVEKRMLERFPGLEKRYKFLRQDLDEFSADLPENSAIFAIHACGNLTDNIMDIGFRNSKPFAIVTCCHNYREQNSLIPADILPYFENKDDCLDVLRVKRVLDAGWNVYVRSLPKKITDKNRVIIGVPPALPE